MSFVGGTLAALRRNLEMVPSPLPDRPGLLLRDPFRYSEVVLVIPPPVVPCLAFFNGHYPEAQVREALMGLTADPRVGEFLGHLSATLSDAGFLEDEAFERMRGERHREFAGAARRAWEDLIRFGYVRRGFLGVEMSSAIEDDAGARILSVLPDSPAHRAGIRPGDVITSYGKYPVANTRQLYALVAGTTPHVRVDIGYQRGAMGYLATVELEESVSTPGPRPVPRSVTEPQVPQPVAQDTPR